MITNKQLLQLYLDADRFALGCSNEKFFSTKINLVWMFEVALRKYEYYYNTQKNPFLLLFYKIRFKRLSYLLGFTIPINVFGPGLRINHYGLIVVNGMCKIGKWCDIHQGVNIGDNGYFDDDGLAIHCVATIGDYCFIGPGAKLFGDIHIGNENRIGANSVVNKSTEDGMLVYGNPMHAQKVEKKTLTIACKEFEELFLNRYPQYRALI